MKPRFPLHNTVLPGKIHEIRDGLGSIIGEIAAGTASEALHIACEEWGAQCRSATPSKTVMVGVKKMRYQI